MPATKNTPSTHHPRRRNVITLTDGLKKKRSHTQKSHQKNGEPWRYSWGTQKQNNNKTTKKRPRIDLLSSDMSEPELSQRPSGTASASRRTADPGIEPHFPRSSQTGDLYIYVILANLAPGVMGSEQDLVGPLFKLWLGEVPSLIIMQLSSVAARILVSEDPFLRSTLHVAGTCKQATNKLAPTPGHQKQTQLPDVKLNTNN